MAGEKLLRSSSVLPSSTAPAYREHNERARPLQQQLPADGVLAPPGSGWRAARAAPPRSAAQGSRSARDPPTQRSGTGNAMASAFSPPDKLAMGVLAGASDAPSSPVCAGVKDPGQDVEPLGGAAAQKLPQQRAVAAAPPVRALSIDLVATYRKVDPGYRYSSTKQRHRRTLTKDSVATSNNQRDNAASDLIMIVGDVLADEKHGQRFRVEDLLGCGTFGQVVYCEDLQTGAKVALKVIRNKPAYFNQALTEIRILQDLNRNHDANDEHHIVRLLEHGFFMCHNHLCLKFELLSVNLFELVKHNHFKGMHFMTLRSIAKQLLESLKVIHAAGVIHCDLKPENILLEREGSSDVKVIDFGSACSEQQLVYSYIQSRFYRAPEVLVGFQYTPAIDMWSTGCIVAEMFLGLPIFPGISEYNQLARIVEMLGSPPDKILRRGRRTKSYFVPVTVASTSRSTYRLMTEEEFTKSSKTAPVKWKRYFPERDIFSLISNYGPRRPAQDATDSAERRLCFTHFLTTLLNMNPEARLTAEEALAHPFITGEHCEKIMAWKPPQRSDPINIIALQANSDGLGAYASLPVHFSAEDSRQKSPTKAARAASSGTPPSTPTKAIDAASPTTRHRRAASDSSEVCGSLPAAPKLTQMYQQQGASVGAKAAFVPVDMWSLERPGQMPGSLPWQSSPSAAAHHAGGARVRQHLGAAGHQGSTTSTDSRDELQDATPQQDAFQVDL